MLDQLAATVRWKANCTSPERVQHAQLEHDEMQERVEKLEEVMRIGRKSSGDTSLVDLKLKEMGIG